MQRRPLFFLAIVISMLSLVASGCASAPAQREEASLTELQDSVERLRRSLSGEFAALRAELSAQGEKLDELKKAASGPAMEQAPGQPQTSAETSPKLASNYAGASPKPAESALEAHLPASEAPQARMDAAALDPQKTYATARALYTSQKYPQAAALFKALGLSHPQHPLAPNALYWLAECHYSLKDYAQSLAYFDMVTHEYPKSAKAPDALLKTAYAYSNLGQANMAIVRLNRLLELYPKSEAAGRVRQGRVRF